MPTPLGSAVEFLQDFGFFDVILPFLLVFTIVFGILEKTKIFGVEKVGDKEYPKKSINSMIAFTIAFFVIAAKEVVASIQVSLPQVVLVLIVLVCFMMLAGSFMGDKQFSLEKHTTLVSVLTVVILIAVVMIFMNSFGWLEGAYKFFSNSSYLLVPIVFLLVILGAIMYVMSGDKSKGGKD